MTDYKLTVCCVTYNHEKYIAQALDGFLMQKTNFPFQVLVGDDASTDSTAKIVQEYAQKYPEIIKPIFHDVNVGAFNNSHSLYKQARTKYVAICDGDDYWIDENKLQKQVDFLDAHPECSVCFHPVRVVWDDGRKDDAIYPDAKMLKKVRDLNFTSLLKRNFIQTNSIVFRWRFCSEDISDFFKQEVASGDWYLNLLHAQIGEIGFIPDVMAVYRRNAGGVWTGAGKSSEWFCKYGLAHLRFWELCEEQFNIDKYQEKEFFKRAIFYASLCCQNKKLEERYSYIKKPIENIFINKICLIGLKILKKVTWGKVSGLYSAKYKSLKLYNMWLAK